jgi:outer membrane protein assembly factor BamB
VTPTSALPRHARHAASALALLVALAACGEASVPVPNASTAAAGATPAPSSSAEAPRSSLPPIGDVVAYKADAFRSGVMPGPDIATKPVLAWQTNIECAVAERAVVIGDATVVVGCNDPRLYGLDARTGAIRWKADIAGAVQGSAAIADGRVFVTTAGGDVEARSIVDGSLLWAKDIEGTANPVVATGVLYIGTQTGARGLATGDGSTTWEYTTGGPSHVTVLDGVAYVGAPNGAFRAVDVATGQTIWEQRVRSAAASSPVLSGNTVFVGARQEGPDPEGELYAFDRATGDIRWTDRTESGLQLGPSAIVEDTLLARSEDEGLFAYVAGTGSVRWNAPQGSGFSPVSATGGVIYATGLDQPSNTYQLLAVGAADGALLWSVGLEGQPAASPIASGGMLFLGAACPPGGWRQPHSPPSPCSRACSARARWSVGSTSPRPSRPPACRPRTDPSSSRCGPTRRSSATGRLASPGSMSRSRTSSAGGSAGPSGS